MQHSVGDAYDVNRTGQEEAWAVWGGEMDAGEATLTGGGAVCPAERPLEHLGHADCSQHLAGKAGHVVREDALAGVDTCVGKEHNH